MLKTAPHGPRLLNLSDDRFGQAMERKFHRMVVVIRTGYFRPEQTFQSSWGEIKIARRQIVKIDGIYRLQSRVNDESCEVNMMKTYFTH